MSNVYKLRFSPKIYSDKNGDEKNEKLRKPHHKDATYLPTHKKIKIEKMGN